MKIVIVIIDMQQGFFLKEHLAQQKEILVKNINNLISTARDLKIPIIWVRQIMKADSSDLPLRVTESPVLEGNSGSELIPKLNRKPNDYEIIKKRYSTFFNTTFESLLKKLNVDTLVVCGINTHACVRMTVIDAYQRDYDVIVAKDCVASYDDQHHAVTMKYFEPTIATIKSSEEIIKDLETSK